MAVFKVYDCDFGVKINGVTYDFPNNDGMTIEDPESTKLVRGSNAADKEGLIYKEGSKEPKRITVTIQNMSVDLKEALDAAYSAKTRCDVFCVSRSDGSSKIAKNSILSVQPQQLSVEDSQESMNVLLIFESFDLTEIHKS